jgi:DNA-binding transcriptional MerR regulator
MERSMSIGQLASATGMAAKTIRYYEARGVLPAPRRTAAGYRQYARRDVHRTLFIRRARALGLPLSRLKALAAELDGRPSRAVRGRLEQMVTEQLRAVRRQIADSRVLEQQLEQVLRRLRSAPAATSSDTCGCLEGAGTSTSYQTPSQPRPRTRGGAGRNSRSTIDAMTRLAGASNGDCDCGCCCGGSVVPATPSGLPVPSPRPAVSAEPPGPRRRRSDTTENLSGRRT